MIFTKTEFEGVYIIELEKKEDERGFFARYYDLKKFKEMGLNPKIAQCSISFNKKKGTIRGMHYQTYPFQEEKLVWCNKGKIFDVIIDLRPKSKTFKKWLGVTLDSFNKIIYIPKGFAHGFQTLQNNTFVNYQISEFFLLEFSRGIKWNDSSFQIKWPIKPTVISKKDKSYQKFRH